MKKIACLSSAGFTTVLFNCRVYDKKIMCGAGFFSELTSCSLKIKNLSDKTEMFTVEVPENIIKAASTTYAKVCAKGNDLQIKIVEVHNI